MSRLAGGLANGFVRGLADWRTGKLTGWRAGEHVGWWSGGLGGGGLNPDAPPFLIHRARVCASIEQHPRDPSTRLVSSVTVCLFLMHVGAPHLRVHTAKHQGSAPHAVARVYLERVRGEAAEWRGGGEAVVGRWCGVAVGRRVGGAVER